MVLDNINDFEDFKCTGVATVQLFNNKGELIEEQVKKNAINTKVGNYYYTIHKQGCISYTNTGGYTVSNNMWQVLNLTHSRWVDTYESADKCMSYKQLSYANLYTPYSGGETNRGTINVAETTRNYYSGTMSRKTYVPYINYVVDFPTHASNITFDTIYLTGNAPYYESYNDYSKYYYWAGTISKACIVHNDRAYAIEGYRMGRTSCRWDKYANENFWFDLFPSDGNKNHYAYHCFYNNRLYVFSNNISTGQLDILEVLNYESNTPTVTTIKSNLETDSSFVDICDVVVREGKIFILRGKHGTKEHRVVVFNLSNFAKLHTHDFTSLGYNKRYRGQQDQSKNCAFNLKNRIAFYVNHDYSSSNYGHSTRIDILTNDYSHVDWNYNTQASSGANSSYIMLCRFSNLYGIRIGGDAVGAYNGKYFYKMGVDRFTGLSHIVKLDSPVTKTETNTMKIQYRVEFENVLEPTVPYADEFGNVWN